ncbi:MAG: hypothetical protein NWE89_09470 [Candidatus Bathyarchaeota archaeon]|nr:hypothetical protein [Candidatus Bathyarchaeota archaeon]
MSRRRRRRGYPEAILIGLDDKQARLWEVYSKSVKPSTELSTTGSSYNFFEAIVDKIRPAVKQGVKTVMIASGDEDHYKAFMTHVRKHQSWLLKGYELNIVTFQFFNEPASDIEDVRRLVAASDFKTRLRDASQGDVAKVMEVLEKRLNSSEGIDTLLFTLNEVEDAVYGNGNVEYILITEEFQYRHRRRTQKLLQVAANKGIKTRIVKLNTSPGARLTQFGGLVCLLKDTV